MYDDRLLNKLTEGGGAFEGANGATFSRGERERERVTKGSWRVVTRARNANRGGCSACTVVKHVRAWFAVPST